MAYADETALAKTTAFIDRVEACLVANAKFIAASRTETAARKALAYLILNSTRTYAVLFTSGIAGDPTVIAAAGSPVNHLLVTDAQINGAIAAVYGGYVQP